MEFGEVSPVKSVNDNVLLYHSVRKPGFVYMFNRKKGNELK